MEFTLENIVAAYANEDHIHQLAVAIAHRLCSEADVPEPFMVYSSCVLDEENPSLKLEWHREPSRNTKMPLAALLPGKEQRAFIKELKQQGDNEMVEFKRLKAKFGCTNDCV